MRRWPLLALALLAGCLDFQQAESRYCATHPGCPDAGPATGGEDAGEDVDAGEEPDAGM